jgi:hypothetical protein
VPARKESRETNLDEMRRRAADLGLPWVSAWDGPRLNALLRRAQMLKDMRLGHLKQEAARIEVHGGERTRKADWVKAILAAEFPDTPTRPPAAWAARGGAPARLLRFSGAAGTVLLVAAMAVLPFGAWRLSQAARAGLLGVADWATNTGVVLRQSSLGLRSASEALRSSNQALRSVSTSLSDAQPLLGSVGEVLGTQAPEAISAARQSLINAESGAQAIDRVLKGLSLLGFGYNPDQPLAQGLAETANSLEPLPAALSRTSDHLQTTQDDLTQVTQDVVQVSDDLANMAAQISPVADDLRREANGMDQLAAGLTRSADGIRGWVWAATALLEVLFLLAAVTQYAVWSVGHLYEVGDG